MKSINQHYRTFRAMSVRARIVRGFIPVVFENPTRKLSDSVASVAAKYTGRLASEDDMVLVFSNK
ncbi:predicted protein [Botrytis cinerea T4]|uniref:Uncharacterized protein n=1 Tax=Botryotinia fuckeliana (strain T4) TaxID=999810 RepID=G2YP89_BOTF4|nr:predicted protein [Botrytis cinerea T4]